MKVMCFYEFFRAFNLRLTSIKRYTAPLLMLMPPRPKLNSLVLQKKMVHVSVNGRRASNRPFPAWLCNMSVKFRNVSTAD